MNQSTPLGPPTFVDDNPMEAWIREVPGAVRCPACGYVSMPKIIDDRKDHRRYHTEYLRPRLPKPDRRLADEDMRVDRRSSRWLHRLVYDRAHALKRDERLDFTQWTVDGKGLEDTARHKDYHAWLLIEATPKGPVPVGAAAFNWILWTNAEPCWRLDFVWIAEGWRRRGVLSRRWPTWRATYGDFWLETPLSDAMLAFVFKHGGPPCPAQREEGNDHAQ